MTKTMNTTTMPLATLTFQASSGYQETYHAMTWNEYHLTCQTMERRGFVKVSENVRAPGF